MRTSPFFISLVLAIMIVPTITSSTILVYAQITTPQSNDVRNRTYGPQQPVSSSSSSTPEVINNVTTTINQTAIEGIENMQQLVNMLEPDIQRFNLVNTFNEAWMQFAWISGNVTALQNHTNNVINASQTSATQAQTQITALQNQVAGLQADLAAAQSAAEEEEEEPEPEAEEETTEEEADDAPEEEEEPDPEPEPEPQETIEDLVNNGGGPRTDPEGDGGFPGDIDG
jgi:hypothetical protein